MDEWPITPVLFARVVLATDLTPSWDEIVSCGGELQKLGCYQVILTHVITSNFFTGPEAVGREQIAPRLAVQRKHLEDQGLQVIIETPLGLPGFSLNEVALKHDASLIVIGSHGQSRWREGVLGSFSGAVLHNARFPLLILPVRVLQDGQPASCLWRCTDLLSHLLLPTDFSEIAAQALCYLELLAPKGVSRVTLLHALAGLTPGADRGGTAPSEARASSSLEVLRARLEAAGVPQVQARLTVGHPISVILELLKTTDISLIVLGTQGKGFIEEIFLGSVAHNISRMAPCPILLIPSISRGAPAYHAEERNP